MDQHDFDVLHAACERQLRLDFCDGCTACALRCSAEVPAARHEWEAIRTYLAGLSPERRAAIADIEAQEKSVDLGDGVRVSMCRYYDMTQDRCSIYPVRPLVCRILGHVEWMPCPIDRIPSMLPTPTALHLMDAYADLERRTLDEWQE